MTQPAAGRCECRIVWKRDGERTVWRVVDGEAPNERSEQTTEPYIFQGIEKCAHCREVAAIAAEAIGLLEQYRNGVLASDVEGKDIYQSALALLERAVRAGIGKGE